MKTIVLALAAALILTGTAVAQDKAEACHHDAKIARLIAEDRDNGVPSAKARAVLEKRKKLAPGLRDSIDDLITLIYGNPSKSADWFAAQVFEGCIQLALPLLGGLHRHYVRI